MVITLFDFQLNRFLIFINLSSSAHNSVFAAPNSLEEKTLDDLDELEDEEDERVLEEYRRKRIAEMKELASKCKYGEVQEISAEDYVKEVNNAGEDVWVILHLYKSGYNETKQGQVFTANVATKLTHSIYFQHSTLFSNQSAPCRFSEKVSCHQVFEEYLHHLYSELARQQSSYNIHLSRWKYGETNYRTARIPWHETV